MPIYEYQCDHCGHHLEALQKISDKPLRECPECGRHRLKRLMSAPLFRLAGSGWYETDFKSDKEAKRNLLDKGDKEPSSEAKTETTSETKSVAKPASASESKPAVAPATGAARRRAVKSASGSPAKAATRKKAPARGRKR
ncbi:MAG: FmdB family zinc ribbon protein [Steroidobacteraceae bacterium]